MSKHLHFDGERFAYWTTNIEPEDYWTYAMTESEAKALARDEWGASFIRDQWDDHLQRAREHGCSAFQPFRCDVVLPFPTATQPDDPTKVERVVIPSVMANCPSCDGRDWHRYGGNMGPKGSQDVLRCTVCGQLAETEWSADPSKVSGEEG